MAFASVLQLQAFGDFLLQAGDETIGSRFGIPAGAKCVLQLSLAEGGQALADPADVRGGNALEQRLVAAAIVEPHVATFDAEDEPGLVEDIRIAARRSSAQGGRRLAENRAPRTTAAPLASSVE